MSWLATVSDPEIPVLSIVDLGLVRKLDWEGDTCVVTITPTYSGCPAMQEIQTGIRDVLQAQGVQQLRIDTQLSPAWTTDWMTQRGREQLQGYGIAPPAERAINISGLTRRTHDVVVACPLCGSDHTRVISQFGSTACKALYRCQACGEPFDYFKAH
ncbi:phenylacetate-CoA oxygenase subunit PaaJ [Pusillimonas sp. MFBS29]|uniref:1,2-phenylacetyl-CoA epoxidase subunit PaaD n=1 Tax=Pusillimonas sp. MFBS29 TaxID=2886690 RepID=UPI001D115BED|nr:1,2-phenylacetyl-CoA epoxidase subunit PaaD [Pusillimonas sp. MFBS29]MCC2595278.1 phenylacetate-CoA oxygenase subunit PaaJ [Pusillimonas sp. MFBS29]